MNDLKKIITECLMESFFEAEIDWVKIKYHVDSAMNTLYHTEWETWNERNLSLIDHVVSDLEYVAKFKSEFKLPSVNQAEYCLEGAKEMKNLLLKAKENSKNPRALKKILDDVVRETVITDYLRQMQKKADLRAEQQKQGIRFGPK